MKFSAFREEQATKIKGSVVNHLNNLPGGEWAGRRIVRDESAAHWDLQLLDNRCCLSCGGDLVMVMSPSGAPNINYYTCKENVLHKFTRVGPPLSGMRRLLAAADNVIAGRPGDDDLEKIDKLLIERMGGA